MTQSKHGDVIFENLLKQPVDVFYSFEINQNSFRVKPFRDNDTSSSRVEAENSKSFIMNNLPNSFKLEIEVGALPIKDGNKAIKIIPGTGIGDAHHTELQLEQRNGDNFYIFKIHYNFFGKPKTHVDPKVIHPDDPEQ